MSSLNFNNRPFCGDVISINTVDYIYLNDDNPQQAYDNKDLCFIAQPLKDNNILYNNIVVPLMMGDMWNIIQDEPKLISRLRGSEKKFKYGFIGSCNHAGRNIFKELKLDDYLFEDNRNQIWSMSSIDKRQSIIKFLTRLSECEYVFAPRGVGSSSFRLYEAMSVGSIPIVTGMIEYPFESRVRWDDMCFRGELRDIELLINKCDSTSIGVYNQMRERSMDFWDYYCRHDRLYNKLIDIIDDNI
tara:strand:+ start:482 stop:1213 length:732 start_codon:yes stop_codon:yes gene_type:complete